MLKNAITIGVKILGIIIVITGLVMFFMGVRDCSQEPGERSIAMMSFCWVFSIPIVYAGVYLLILGSILNRSVEDIEFYCSRCQKAGGSRKMRLAQTGIVFKHWGRYVCPACGQYRWVEWKWRPSGFYYKWWDEE